MPYALFAPHVTEKGYMYVFAIIVRSPERMSNFKFLDDLSGKVFACIEYAP
ncbi:hypothetical protein [Microcoleus sp. SVA1_B3]|uniref:hypothetical protein n=1 Tax=Microcoleus sp. SVA1_B3 TaxID=2818950 RepID=UPI002FD52E48